MELATAIEEDASAGGSAALDPVDSRSPIENPSMDPIPDDPLLEPHPHEPGVLSDGTAAPLENPDDNFLPDPLANL